MLVYYLQQVCFSLLALVDYIKEGLLTDFAMLNEAASPYCSGGGLMFARRAKPWVAPRMNDLLDSAA